MGHCEDCRWWEMQADYPAGYGACNNEAKIRTEIEPTEDDDAVMILDADCYLYSQVVFGPRFGCVHFEEGERSEVICNRQD